MSHDSPPTNHTRRAPPPNHSTTYRPLPAMLFLSSGVLLLALPSLMTWWPVSSFEMRVSDSEVVPFEMRVSDSEVVPFEMRVSDSEVVPFEMRAADSDAVAPDPAAASLDAAAGSGATASLDPDWIDAIAYPIQEVDSPDEEVGYFFGGGRLSRRGGGFFGEDGWIRSPIQSMERR